MFLSKDSLDGNWEAPDTGAAAGGSSSGAARGEYVDEREELATPTSVVNLRAKMAEQKKRALTKQRTGPLGATSMVMANENLSFGNAATPKGERTPASQKGADSQPLLSPASTTMSLDIPAVTSTPSAMSLAEEPSSEMVMPDNVPDTKEEEARRRSSLAAKLDEQGICPVYEPDKCASFSGDCRFDVGSIAASDMKAFLYGPAPKHVGMIECRITRDQGRLNRLYPRYIMESDSGVFLMIAKKQSQNKTANYAITMSRTDTGKESEHFLGKLRSDFCGLEFTGFGPGMNPSKIDKKMPQADALRLTRQELLSVRFSSSVWGSQSHGPRKMAVTIPRICPNGERLVCQTMYPESEGLSALQRSGNMDHLIETYHNKSPKWNDSIGAYVLNFNKRVTQASVKNFQLTTADNPDTVYLQFGRVGKETFNLDFRHPISPLQAFSICLSSFDYKLCCA